MRVLHIIPSLDPQIGGPPAVATRLAAAQSAVGMKVGILSYGDEAACERIISSVGAIPWLDGVSLHTLTPPSAAEKIFGTNAGAYVMSHAKDFDVLHLHGVWEAILRSTANSAFQLGKPYLLAPHGMLDPWSMQQKKLKKNLALALGYRAMLNRASMLHALNVDERDLLAPLRITAPVVIIPNGIFLNEIEPAPPKGSFAKTLPAIEGRPYILFLSRLHYKKGLDYLIGAFREVAKKLSDVHLVVAGPDAGARENLERETAAASLQSRVHIVGPLYGAQKIAALYDATVFCLPSRQEGFSVAITEALACSVPVVISTACHFPEVAQAGAGIVTELDSQQVASGLLKILSDNNLREQMGRAGRELVLSKYAWKQIARLTGDYYRAALQNRQATILE